jgi:LysM repeat protein
MKLLCRCSILFAVLSAHLNCHALSAQRFVVPKPDGKEIEVNKDHYTVGVLGSWVASKDSLFKSLVSKKSRLAVCIDSKLTFFDGSESQVTVVAENIDMFRKTSRPWGVNCLLFDKAPADATSKIDIKVMIYREDRIRQIISTLTDSQGTVASLFDAQWVGYSNVARNMINTLWSTDRTSFPFHWTGPVFQPSDFEDGKMKEEYIVLISPSSDDDSLFQNIDGRSLSFDPGRQVLKLDGTNLVDHSYVVFGVTKAANPKVVQLLNESQAPWAKLALSEFTFRPVIGAKNADTLTSLAENFFNQLKTEADLLKAEHRFSKIDRASALSAFGAHASDLIKVRWAQLKLKSAECPTLDLDYYVTNCHSSFDLPQESAPYITSNSALIVSEIVGKPYIVVDGDTTTKIASKFHVSVAAVSAANLLLGTTNLTPGQKIFISGLDPSALTNAPVVPNLPAPTFYTIKSGDSLATVAKHLGVTMKVLHEANLLKTDKIKVGQELRIPPKK